MTVYKSVHPHGCGERFSIVIINDFFRGSSPRVWGTYPHPTRRAVSARFIPTGVGNVNNSTNIYKNKPVHPHGCGERGIGRHFANRMIGSSPRVWGTSASKNPMRAISRFIPTGVGNVLTLLQNSGFRTVHPHGCGERFISDLNVSHVARFIPTGVGNVISLSLFFIIFYGSSPRVWGTSQIPHNHAG